MLIDVDDLKQGIENKVTRETFTETYIADWISLRQLFDLIDEYAEYAKEVESKEAKTICIHEWKIIRMDYAFSSMDYIGFRRQCKRCGKVQIANAFDIAWRDEE